MNQLLASLQLKSPFSMWNSGTMLSFSFESADWDFVTENIKSWPYPKGLVEIYYQVVAFVRTE